MQKKKRQQEPPSTLVYTNRSVEAARKRRLIALFCKMLGNEILAARGLKEAPPSVQPSLISLTQPALVLEGTSTTHNGTFAPRQVQTLELLLTGLSEKEVATNLQISRHTVHVYVKSLYKRFNVTSRAELLAKWVKK